jgi:hypothetical protein
VVGKIRLRQNSNADQFDHIPPVQSVFFKKGQVSHFIAATIKSPRKSRSENAGHSTLFQSTYIGSSRTHMLIACIIRWSISALYIIVHRPSFYTGTRSKQFAGLTCRHPSPRCFYYYVSNAMIKRCRTIALVINGIAVGP